MDDRLPGETDKAWRAFQDFCALEEARSLAELYRQYNDKKRAKKIVPTKSQKTLLGWSSKFDWFDRAKTYDARKAGERVKVLEQEEKGKWQKEAEECRDRARRIGASLTETAILAQSLLNELIRKKRDELTPAHIIKLGNLTAKFAETGIALESTALGITQLLEGMNEKD